MSFEAQLTVLTAYVTARSGTVVATFEESESGKNDARPVLAEAIAHAKKTKSILLVKSICRLGRSLAKVCSILDDDLNLEISDIPTGCPKMMLQMMAMMADHEGKMISTRTKDALQVLKANGKVLGNPKLKEVRQKSIQVRKNNATAFKMRIRPIALRMVADGCSAAEVAKNLNDLGIKTIRNQQWKSTNVSYLLN
ncbi:MAG: recombinase family protein [Anabaena sp. 49628_E55]|nr:recombinase family protein [Anabaena sp. 49628_E55]